MARYALPLSGELEVEEFQRRVIRCFTDGSADETCQISTLFDRSVAQVYRTYSSDFSKRSCVVQPNINDLIPRPFIVAVIAPQNSLYFDAIDYGNLTFWVGANSGAR